MLAQLAPSPRLDAWHRVDGERQRVELGFLKHNECRAVRAISLLCACGLSPFSELPSLGSSDHYLPFELIKGCFYIPAYFLVGSDRNCELSFS